ncbi:hypothetical protein GCM10027258_62800 [Amycolatopsis stemonae]
MQSELSGGTLGAIFGMVACALVFLLALPLSFFIAENRRERVGYPLVVLIAGAVVAGAFWWGMYPWKSEYHHWNPVSGVVDTVDSRRVATGDQGATEDKFVVTFRGNPQQYGVLDTRAAGVKPGDTLSITCKRAYQWSGTHGYDCNFVDLKRAKE